METASAAGFHVRLEFIAIKSAVRSAERVSERVAKGGHNIPAEAIARRFDKVMDNLPKAAAHANEFAIRDNDQRAFRTILHVHDDKEIYRAADIPEHLRDAIDRIDGRDSNRVRHPLR